MFPSEVRVVFLDTNVFESAKFKYDSINMQRFLAVCKDNKIKIIISDVVKNEVIKRIKSNIELAVSDIEKHSFSILLSSLNLGILSKPKIIEHLSSKLINDFQEFLVDYDIEVILSNYEQNELMKLYFETQAPFSEQKKHEFPDAIIALTVKKYRETECETLLMVSNDNDIKNFCIASDIGCYDTISDVVHKLNSESPHNIYALHKQSISDKIKEQILKYDDFVLYSYDSIDEVYIEDIKATAVEIEKIDVLNIDSSENSIELEAVASITFKCRATYPDTDTMGYDKEDGVYYFSQYINASIKIERKINCIVNVSFYEDEFIIDDLDLESKEFEFSLDDRNIESFEYIEQFGSTRW